MADVQITRAIELAIAGSIGLVSSLIIRWFDKHKTKEKILTEETNEITEAAGKAVEASGQVVDMLKCMLAEQGKHFNDQIERAKASCSLEIDAIREEHGKQIEKLVMDNIAFRSEVETLKKENLSLHNQVLFLTVENSNKDEKLFELKNRLSIYENEKERL